MKIIRTIENSPTILMARDFVEAKRAGAICWQSIGHSGYETRNIAVGIITRMFRKSTTGWENCSFVVWLDNNNKHWYFGYTKP